MKLQTTWNEHDKIWHYFTTSREAQAARVEGVVFKAAVGLWRSIAAYACKSCGTETDTHTPDCERAPRRKKQYQISSKHIRQLSLHK
jgi:hypothetical protein